MKRVFKIGCLVVVGLAVVVGIAIGPFVWKTVKLVKLVNESRRYDVWLDLHPDTGTSKLAMVRDPKFHVFWSSQGTQRGVQWLLRHRDDLSGLVSMSVTPPATPEQMVELCAAFPNLRMVSFSDHTDVSHLAPAIAALHSPETVHVLDTTCDDAALLAAIELKSLKYLDISRCDPYPSLEVIKKFRYARPDCVLTVTPRAGRDGSGITDEKLAELALLNPQLLALHKSDVTDEGLVHLKGLQALMFISLKETAITDAGLVHLHGLPKLESIYLKDTAVTDEAVKKLQAATPSLKQIER